MDADEIRQELARLLLAHWELEREADLVRTQIKHVELEIKRLGDQLDAGEYEPEDVPSAPAEQDDLYSETCGLRMQSGGYCAKPAGHELAGSGEARQHRSAESLASRAASKNARSHAGRRS